MKDLKILKKIMKTKNKPQMEKFFYILKSQNLANFRTQEKKNHFKKCLLWTVWLIILVQYFIFSEKNDTPFPKDQISNFSIVMYEILQKDPNFSYVLSLIKKKTKIFSCSVEYPHINIEIFSSQMEHRKLNLTLLACILNCLFCYKKLMMSKGSYIIYYDHFKFFFQHISAISEFPLDMYTHGLPKNIIYIFSPQSIGTNNWLEKTLDYSTFQNEFFANYEEIKRQDHTSIHMGMKSHPIRESIYLLKLLFYLQMCIPWNLLELYQNVENRVFCYYLSHVIFMYVVSVLVHGRRNLFNLIKKILTSTLFFFIEKAPTTQHEELIKIIQERKTGPDCISFLNLCEQICFRKDQFLKNFLLDSNRSNENNLVGTRGILRSSSFLDIVAKKIEKGQNSSASAQVVQECYLCCGHSLSSFKDVIQSPFLSGNEIPFPCTCCDSLRIGNFLIFDLHKNHDGNIEKFHQWLESNDCSEENFGLSYFLKMSKNGDLINQKIKVSETGSKMNLPFRKQDGSIHFKMMDPSYFVLKFYDTGFLFINDKKISIRDLICQNIQKYPQFSSQWFPTHDCFEWIEKAISTLNEKGLSFGTYSFRGVSTFLCNLLKIPTHIAQAIFGWISKEGTQQRHYNHDSDLRTETRNQIYFQYSIYNSLLNFENFNFYDDWKSIMEKDSIFTKNLEKFGPLKKPT